MKKMNHDTTRGILRAQAINRKFHLSRLFPSTDLKEFIEHYWVVRWDLRGEKPYLSETLPFPSVHIVIEHDHPEVYGVVLKKFTRLLEGQGRVFGIKFRPGMFQPFLGASVSALTDKVVKLHSIFGKEAIDVKEAVLNEFDEKTCVHYFETFLRTKLPEAETICIRIRDVTELIATDRTIVRVEQIASLLTCDIRYLQRIFRKYIGVSPKWVIKRYRIQEAAEALVNENSLNMSTLALHLGYFDQAHFIRDFKSIIGWSPSIYREGNSSE